MYVFRSRTRGEPLFCFACGEEVEDTATQDLKASGLYAHNHTCPEGTEDKMAFCFITGGETDCTPVKNDHIRETDCQIYHGRCRKGLVDWDKHCKAEGL